MTRTDVAYQAVGKGGEDSGGSAGENSEDRGELPQHNENNHHHKEKQELQQRPKRKEKRCLDTDDVIVEEVEELDDEFDSNNNDPPSPTSSRGRGSVLRRTMSFLATLPRKLFSYVREVFYTPQQRWSKVGQDQDSEESDWSSSEDGTTSRANKHRRSAGKSRDRHRAKNNKPTPPPIAPKPKKKYNISPSGSSNPPSSPDTTSPDTTPEISFDDIVIDSPQLKPYKRIHGPQGRRKPQRFSNQSESRQSELTLESDLSR